MIPDRKRLIALAGALAVLISATDTVGWWLWSGTTHQLRIGSETVAEELTTGRFVDLPSYVERARRLPIVDLVSLPRETAAEILDRLGGLQIKWMPAAAAGFTQSALEMLLLDRPDLATLLLREAVRRDPHSAYLRRLRGLVFLSAGDRESALEELAFAEAVAPGSRSPAVELTEEDDEMVRLRGLEIRREVYPGRKKETAMTLARVLRSSGEPGSARMVLDEFAGHPEIDLEIARWEVEEGNFGEALETLDGITSRTRFPRGLRARAWSSVAIARDQLGDSDGALEAASEALRLDPRSTTPYVTLATLAERRGDNDLALAHLRRAWGMAPSDIGLLLRIARVAERTGKSADALLALDRAVELDPNSPEIAVQLVAAQLRQGRFAEAAVSLSLALDRSPTHPGLLNLADKLRRDVGIR